MLELTHTLSMQAASLAPGTSLNVLFIEARKLRNLAGFLGETHSGRISHDQFIVHRAMNVAEGLETLALGGIDVVILELSELGRKGLKPLFQILEGEPSIPVVILSDCEDDSTACQAIRAGAQDYLVRNRLTGDELLRSVCYAIERHQFLCSILLTDDLTGLRNRRGFITLAEQQLKMARAHRSEASLMLAFVDIDGLKQINDRLGHEAGSDAICDAAHILRTTFREVDVIGRLGGDEFGVLVLDASKDNEATMLRRLNENIQALNQENLNPYRLSLSIGVIEVNPNGADTIEDLVDKADGAMYEHKRAKGKGKRRGQNRI